ncbi:MAG: hypothetical protein K2K00_06445 [Muribaculaceae bacterium]|nr:hypothetical protein [Muribaculaceae bacterium]
MKKFLLPAALLAVLTLGSCSGKGASAGDSVADFKSKIENCTNADSIQAYVGQAQEYVQKLVDEGKIDEAKKYLAEIEPVVKEKAPKLAGVFETVKSFVDKVPAAGEDAVEKAKDAASAAGDSLQSAAENAKDAAAEKISDVKDAISDKAEEVKDAVSEKAGQAIDAVSQKASDVTDAAKDKVNDLLKK